MKIIVDTNVIIDYLRSPYKHKTIFHSLFLNDEHIAVITLVVIAELYAGKSVASGKIKIIIDELINSCEVTEGNIEIYKKAGEIIRDTNRHTFQDAIIAATAIFLKLPLLTLNKKDFKHIKEVLLYDIKLT